MSGDVSVSLFVSVVFGDVVEVISSDNDGSVHFGGEDDALEDLATNADVAGEGAFLIDVLSFDGFLGSLEAKAHIFVIPHTGGGFLGEQLLAVQENIVLLLESTESLS